MNIAPILLILAPFAIAFLIEALTIYFFKLRGIGAAIELAVLINLIVVAVLIWVVMPLLGKIGYGVSALQFPLPVAVFLCWLSILFDGLLLGLFMKEKAKPFVFQTSVVMNILSWAFLFVVKDL